jgi:CheY-like chemotaxis protein
LQRLGYEINVVNNGLEVLSALKEAAYDLILMDVQMPEMDGLTATQQVRAEMPVSQQPAIIAMTANALPGDRERYIAAGMDDYISKPIRIEALIQVLRARCPQLQES